MNNLHFPPGPPPARSLFSILRMMGDYYRNFAVVVSHQFDTHGDVVRLQIGKVHEYLIRHPDHIHQVLLTDAASYNKDPDYSNRETGLAYFLGNGLVTSDGEFWRRQRKLIQPAFHTRRIEAYAGTMVEFTLRMLDGWHDGQRVQVDEAMMNLTLNIVAKTLFDTDVSADAKRIGSALTVLQHKFTSISLLPNRVPTPAHLRERRALDDLNSIVYRLIAARREDCEDRGDLLSMMIMARDDDGSGMTDEQLRDESVTLILAGHETTSNALNWIFTLLAQYPDAEAKLHDELDTVLAGRAPTLDDLKRLPYTDRVVKESLRIYPSVYAFSRAAIEDLTLGEFSVPKGTVIAVFPWATHHDPRWWPEPERFLPERFSEENEKQIPRYAYLPFGGGPRVCIGSSFAMMEARLLLATIAQRYRLKLALGQAVQPQALITLRPSGKLMMTLEARRPRALEAPPESAEIVV